MSQLFTGHSDHRETSRTRHRVTLRAPPPRARQSLRLARTPFPARRYSLCADLGVRNRCTGPLRKAGHFKYVPDGGDGHLERETRGIRPDLVLRASTTPRRSVGA